MKKCGFPKEEEYEMFIKQPTMIEFGHSMFNSEEKENGNELNVHVIDIQCGSLFNICRCSCENRIEIYVFGLNSKGELGLDFDFTKISANNFRHHHIVDIPVLNEFFSDKNIQSVDCGFGHSSCIDFEGNCYLFGDNSQYQLTAIWDEVCLFEPMLLQSISVLSTDFYVAQASLGLDHTLLLTTNNELFTMGSNRSNQCSHRDRRNGYLRDIESVESLMEWKVNSFVPKIDIGLKEDDIIERVIAGVRTSLLVCTCYE